MFFPGLHIIDKNQQIQDPEELDKHQNHPRVQELSKTDKTQTISESEKFDAKKIETLPKSNLKNFDKPLK